MTTIANLVPPKNIQSPDDVLLLYGDQRPKASCIQTAQLKAFGNGYATQEDLEKALREEAKAVGADVVVVGGTEWSSMQVGTYGGGIALGQHIMKPIMNATACRTSTVWHGLRLQMDDKRIIVRFVFDGSPGEKAGIKETDEILTVNGNYLPDNPTAWEREVGAQQPGTVVTLQLLRGGVKQSVTMTLAEAPQ